MGKRKTRSKTLTKIDPSILESKPAAVSQHAAQNGARVTATVNPIFQPPLSPVNPLVFDLDPGNFNEEHLEDDVGDKDASRGYYVARVRAFACCCIRRLIVARIIHCSCGELSARYSSKNLSDSKAKEYPLMTAANSAAKEVCTVVPTVSRSNSFVGVV